MTAEFTPVMEGQDMLKDVWERVYINFAKHIT